MATAVKRKLSESTDGMGIKITNTSTPGTLIHTAVVEIVDGSYDEIWLWAYNSSETIVGLTIEYGNSTSPDHTIKVNLASQSGLIPILPGLILQNSATINAFTTVENVITLTGFVNRITD